METLLQDLRYGMTMLVRTSTDGATVAGVAVLLTGVAFVASWLPARRATNVDPAAALRAN